MIKKYRLEWEYDGWSAVFLVDSEHENFEGLRHSLDFRHIGWETWLEDYDNDLFRVWAMYYGGDLVRLSDRSGVKGVKSEFANMEGNIPINGECGIELIEIDTFEISEYGFEVEEIS
jgi:hypothetical protein